MADDFQVAVSIIILFRFTDGPPIGLLMILWLDRWTSYSARLFTKISGWLVKLKENNMSLLADQLDCSNLN